VGRRVPALSDDDVVALGVEPPPEPPPPRPSGLHGLAITGMSISALLGIVVLFVSIGMGLPSGPRRAAIAVVVGAAALFLTCASIAVFTAARATYPSRGRGDAE
jgi:peptidoglycan/LPS O-acetylase OafA/YrhL